MGRWVGCFLIPAFRSFQQAGSMAFNMASYAFRHGAYPVGLQFPWERGFLGVVMGSRDIIELPFLRAPEVAQRIEPALSPAPTAKEPALEAGVEWEPDGLCSTTALPRLRRAAELDEGGLRGKAIGKWRWIAELAGSASAVFRVMEQAPEHEAAQVLQDACYSKSTATLLKRGGSMLLYAEWAGGGVCFPFTEARIYQYVAHLRQEGALATRASSFLEAVVFTVTLLGIDCEPGATVTARVKGAALASYDRKRLTQQAPPLTVGLVKALEVAVSKASEATDRSVAGFALFVVFSRARLSDAARADSEPCMDAAPGGGGVRPSRHRWASYQDGEREAKAPPSLSAGGASRGSDHVALGAGLAVGQEGMWAKR